MAGMSSEFEPGQGECQCDCEREGASLPRRQLMGAAMLTEGSDIAEIMVKAGLGVAGLLMWLF